MDVDRAQAQMIHEGSPAAPHLVEIALDISEQKISPKGPPRRHAASRRDRSDLRGLRPLGRRQPSGHLQFEVPDASITCPIALVSSCPPIESDVGRHPAGDPGRYSIGKMPASARAPTRRVFRTAAGCNQRTPHEGWRLCLGRHRYLGLETQRGAIARLRTAADCDDR